MASRKDLHRCTNMGSCSVRIEELLYCKAINCNQLSLSSFNNTSVVGYTIPRLTASRMPTYIYYFTLLTVLFQVLPCYFNTLCR